jgi:hypothetical protein
LAGALPPFADGASLPVGFVAALALDFAPTDLVGVATVALTFLVALAAATVVEAGRASSSGR